MAANTRFYPITKSQQSSPCIMGNYAVEVTLSAQDATKLRDHLLAPPHLPYLHLPYPGLQPLPAILHHRLHPHPNNAYHFIVFDPTDAGLAPTFFEEQDLSPLLGDIAWRGIVTPTMQLKLMDLPDSPPFHLPP